MSDEKINIYIEIGDNLRSVMEKTIDDTNTYSDSVGTEGIISTIFSGLRNLVVEFVKAKKEKEIIVQCPTLNKKEDQS